MCAMGIHGHSKPRASPSIEHGVLALIIFHLGFDTEPNLEFILALYQINGNLFCSRDLLRIF
jgi:hypothetical protein